MERERYKISYHQYYRDWITREFRDGPNLKTIEYSADVENSIRWIRICIDNASIRIRWKVFKTEELGIIVGNDGWVNYYKIIVKILNRK